MREITTGSEGLEDGSFAGFKKINEALFVVLVGIDCHLLEDSYNRFSACLCFNASRA